MDIEARMIHQNNDKNHLPKEWIYPEANRFDGAQTLSVARALRIIDQGDDCRDDWYQGGDTYTHLALLEVSGHSGESGGLGYRAVTEDDVEAMHVISLSDIEWTLTEIALDIDDDVIFDEWGMPDIDAMIEEYEDEVIDKLADRAETVEPKFVDTV